jgi:hypothetical protein
VFTPGSRAPEGVTGLNRGNLGLVVHYRPKKSTARLPPGLAKKTELPDGKFRFTGETLAGAVYRITAPVGRGLEATPALS